MPIMPNEIVSEVFSECCLMLMTGRDLRHCAMVTVKVTTCKGQSRTVGCVGSGFPSAVILVVLYG